MTLEEVIEDIDKHKFCREDIQYESLIWALQCMGECLHMINDSSFVYKNNAKECCKNCEEFDWICEYR